MSSFRCPLPDPGPNDTAAPAVDEQPEPTPDVDLAARIAALFRAGRVHQAGITAAQLTAQLAGTATRRHGDEHPTLPQVRAAVERLATAGMVIRRHGNRTRVARYFPIPTANTGGVFEQVSRHTICGLPFDHPWVRYYQIHVTLVADNRWRVSHGGFGFNGTDWEPEFSGTPMFDLDTALQHAHEQALKVEGGNGRTPLDVFADRLPASWPGWVNYPTEGEEPS